MGKEGFERGRAVEGQFPEIIIGRGRVGGRGEGGEVLEMVYMWMSASGARGKSEGLQLNDIAPMIQLTKIAEWDIWVAYW